MMTGYSVSRPVIGVIFVILSAICFAMKGILAKLAYQDGVDPATLLTLRMFAALPFYLYGIFWFGRKDQSSRPPFLSRDFLWIVLLGLLGFDISSVLDFEGLSLISASEERLVLFLYPTFVVFLSWFLFRRRIGGREILSSALAYGGIMIVTWGGGKPGHSSFEGVVLVLLSGFFYSVYLVGVEGLVKRINPLWLTSVVMITATVAIAIQSILAGSLHLEGISNRVFLLSVVMGILSTAIPTFLMSMGIAIIGASRAALLSFLGPVATLFLAMVFLGEKLALREGIGAVLVLAGVMFVAMPGRADRLGGKSGSLRKNG